MALNALLANAGTPLMWAGAFHLLLGNAGIGLLEGWLLARLFRVPAIRTCPWMVLANYFSMIVGYCSLDWVTKWFEEATILNLVRYVTLASVAFFTATVFLELPFVLGCFWKKEHRWSASLLGSLAAQTASYGLLVPYYWHVSGTTLLTSVDVQRDLSFVADPSTTIFFVDSNDRNLYQVRLDGSAPRLVRELANVSQFARLFLRKSAAGDTLDLCLADRDRNEPDVLITRLAADMTTGSKSKFGDERDAWTAFGEAIDLRSKEDRTWLVETGFWPIEGLHARYESGGKSLWLSLETPFIGWYARCATVLPKDQVVYQLNDQIVLVDLESRKIGMIARGHGPVVVLESNLFQSNERKSSDSSGEPDSIPDQPAILTDAAAGGGY